MGFINAIYSYQIAYEVCGQRKLMSNKVVIFDDWCWDENDIFIICVGKDGYGPWAYDVYIIMIVDICVDVELFPPYKCKGNSAGYFSKTLGLNQIIVTLGASRMTKIMWVKFLDVGGTKWVKPNKFNPLCIGFKAG